MYRNTQKMIDRVVFDRQLPPVKKGMRCTVSGREGHIIGGNSSSNFNVRFCGDRHAMNCHPSYEMVIYNEDGEVIHQSKGDTVCA